MEGVPGLKFFLLRLQVEASPVLPHHEEIHESWFGLGRAWVLITGFIQRAKWGRMIPDGVDERMMQVGATGKHKSPITAIAFSSPY
jgi:hypothetical protein